MSRSSCSTAIWRAECQASSSPVAAAVTAARSCSTVWIVVCEGATPANAVSLAPASIASRPTSHSVVLVIGHGASAAARSGSTVLLGLPSEVEPVPRDARPPRVKPGFLRCKSKRGRHARPERLLVAGEQCGGPDDVDGVGDGLGGAVVEDVGGQLDAGAQVAGGTGGHGGSDTGSCVDLRLRLVDRQAGEVVEQRCGGDGIGSRPRRTPSRRSSPLRGSGRRGRGRRPARAPCRPGSRSRPTSAPARRGSRLPARGRRRSTRSSRAKASRQHLAP